VGEGEVAGNEVASKIFGILLTAMAEKNGIYWVASANKVSHLPPEFLRKGRFDNIWYVPFPSIQTRAQIFGIHCRKNDIDLTDINIEEIVKEMNGWTGAEIEHVCIEVKINSVAEGFVPETKHFFQEISQTKGITKMSQRMKELQEWAEENAIFTD